MTYRDPAIYAIEAYRRSPMISGSVPFGYVYEYAFSDVTYTETKHLEFAKRLTLKEASRFIGVYSKALPEFFIIVLIPTFSVPEEYGKFPYVLVQSKM